MAPCAGFVWFRWLRPSKKHVWQRMVLVSAPGEWQMLSTPFATLTTSPVVREFVGKDAQFIRYRKAADECSVCGKTRGGW